MDPSTAVILLQDYHLAIINKLIHNDQYMHTTSDLPEDWESLVTLILNVSYQYDFTDKTREIAIVLFKHYSSQTQPSPSKLPLIALLCLSLATRLDAKCVYGLQSVLYQLNYSFSLDHLILQEQLILQTLQWNLTVTTPIDFASMLLYLSNSYFDFSTIVEQVTNFVFLCLLDLDLSKYSSVTLGITCIMSSLSQMQMHKFKDQFYEFVQDTFPQIEYEEVRQCMKVLSYKIQECASPENLYGETSTGINSPNSITRYKMSGFDQHNFDLISSINKHKLRVSNVNSFMIRPQQPSGDKQQVYTCSATQSFVESEDVDESCFSERDTLERVRKPHIFVSQIEKFFMNRHIHETNEEDDGRTVKYSIVSHDSELQKQTELYRQIRQQKSGSTLKNSLLSYFNSSIGIPDEQKWDQIKISICPLASLYASDHYFDKTIAVKHA